MSNLDNVNGAFSAAVYKKLQKQISPLVEKLVQLQEDTRLIETTPGPKGDKGIKGDQGIAGQDGERGLIGEQGLQGIQGDRGKKGLIGEQGLQGIQGPQGDKGDQGIQGVTGDQGIQGVKGDTGDKGDTGQQGLKGEAGQQGIQGISGNPGKDGQTGPQGIQGIQGESGINGDTGAPGVDGKPGVQGIQGEAGPQGEAGVDGNDGKDAELPDIDKIIEPHFVKVKKELDSYVIKSDRDFTNWKSVINNQISNNAGGGAVKISQLVDVQTSSAKVDGQFLKYDASQKKWVGGSVDISSIVGGAPEALDTLNELAEALNDDENFATTITGSIAAKASQTDLDTHTGNTNNPHSVTATQVGLGSVEDKSSATIRGEIVDSNIPSTITRDSELTAHTSLTNNPHSVTKAHVGLPNVEDKSAATIIGEIVDSDIPSTITRDSELSAHTSLTDNPHTVTATQIGLGNVEDKSAATIIGEIVDGDIPSTITRDSELTAHTSLTNNPHTVTATQIGLGSVDDTTDAAKPVSTAQQTALDLKANLASPSFTGNVVATGVITLDVPDNGGAPATTAIIDINGYEGRGAGIKIQDSKNSAANASNREWFIGSGYASSGFNIGYASDGNQSSYATQTKFAITTAGNVGIGVASATSKLHVKNTSSGNVVRQLRLHNDSITAGTGTGIAFTNSTSETFVSASIDSVRASSSNASGTLVFSTRPDNTDGDSGSIERMRIDENGNVGIGETAPNVKLLVNAGATNSIAIFQSSDDKAVIQIKDNDTNVHLIAKDNKLALGSSTSDTDKFNVDITNGDVISAGVVNAKGVSLNANTFTVVSTTSTLAAATNGLTVILQNTGPITITLPTLAAGHVTTFISETIHGVTFVGDTGIAINSFNGMNTTAGIYAQCQVIYKTTAIAFLGGNLV
tara:strand:+ start:440 stop:3178 length:2739 start_codon:yes stop_codon:yes gene_type:complete